MEATEWSKHDDTKPGSSESLPRRGPRFSRRPQLTAESQTGPEGDRHIHLNVTTARLPENAHRLTCKVHWPVWIDTGPDGQSPLPPPSFDSYLNRWSHAQDLEEIGPAQGASMRVDLEPVVDRLDEDEPFYLEVDVVTEYYHKGRVVVVDEDLNCEVWRRWWFRWKDHWPGHNHWERMQRYIRRREVAARKFEEFYGHPPTSPP